MTKDTLCLADLDAVTASDTPFEFEYIKADGTGSGVFLSVLGSQSEVVTDAVNKLVNARRKQQAQAVATGAKTDFTPIESDLEFGHKLTAVRLVAWRGISDGFTPEGAFRLVSRNARVAEQVTAASNDIGNFTPASPRA